MFENGRGVGVCQSRETPLGCFSMNKCASAKGRFTSVSESGRYFEGHGLSRCILQDMSQLAPRVSTGPFA